MKELLHKRRSNFHKGLKLITICARTEDQDSRTRVRKSFLYNVSRVQDVGLPAGPPQVYIRKHFDTEHKIERFTFQVKGIFYTTNGKFMARVYFHHCLNVLVSWKKSFLPQQVSGSD